MFEKIGFSYKLQFWLSNQILEHDEIYEDTWEAREIECLPYVKNDVLSTGFCHVRYTMGMEELPNFGMKNSSTLLSLANMYFNSLRDENDDPIYTYTGHFSKTLFETQIKAADVIILINIMKVKIWMRFLVLIHKN